MKKAFLFLVACLLGAGPAWAADLTGCQFKGIPLYGKVKVVTFSPDFEVKVTNFMPDINVKRVDIFPNRCGEWQFVDMFPDFTIKFVDFFPDFEIKFVDVFPGVR